MDKQCYVVAVEQFEDAWLVSRPQWSPLRYLAQDGAIRNRGDDGAPACMDHWPADRSRAAFASRRSPGAPLRLSQHATRASMREVARVREVVLQHVRVVHHRILGGIQQGGDGVLVDDLA